MVHLRDLIQFTFWLRHIKVLQFLYTVDNITLCMCTPSKVCIHAQRGSVQKVGIQVSPS